jgi:uncharacterized protein
MNDANVIDATLAFIRDKFLGETTGHDYWHMYRVWKLAKYIALAETGVDQLVLELGALLHDVADWKFHNGDEEAGPRAAREWLESKHVDDKTILAVEDIIRTVSFKGAGLPSNMKTIEGKIIHDADKLDALGAIGLARVFAYSGAHNRPIHDPTLATETHDSFETYKKSNGTAINHFYEKLLLLKDRMYTNTGKKIALHRHKLMEDYLVEFYSEWDGQA